MKVGVLGAGAWGTALAIITAKSNNDVILWSYDGCFNQFDNLIMPSNIHVVSDMKHLAETDAWLIVTPAAYFRETVKQARYFYKNQPVIVCTKGIEAANDKFMSEILDQELPECSDYGVLSGPQFAKEVATGVPTGSTLAGTTTALAAGRIALSQLYLEESDDVIGAEICGVGKNAVALISGFISVRARGENEKAMIITRAWNEVVQFGTVSGAKTQTFLSLCGLGDLFLSATSKTSRNYAAGMALAQNEPVTGTVEGIYALKGLIERAAEKKIATPILCDMQAQMGLGN